MTEPALEGPFGDLGLATYDEETQEWHFARDLSEQSRLKTPTDSRQTRRTLPNGAERPGSHHNQQLRRIVSTHPELYPAGAIVPSLLHVSGAVLTAVNQFDVAVGSRLSLGYLYDYGQNRPISIAAFASGHTGNTISIVKLRRRQQQPRGGTQHARLDVPVPSGYVNTWDECDTPVRQILLARTTEPHGVASLLAARLIDRTIVLRLVSSRDGVAMHPVHEIIKDASEPDHADVAFNPWYFRQYAVIDMAGNWRVWQSENKAGIEHSLVAQHISAETVQVLDDGWKRIVWVGSSTMLAICSRTEVQLYSIETDVAWLQDIDVSLQQPDCWILDVIVEPHLPNILFVLTGTHLLAYLVTTTHSDLVVQNLVKLRHHLNQKDMTLRLHAIQEDDAITVYLLSKLNGVGMSYKLGDITGPTPTLKGPASTEALTSILQSSTFDMLMLPVALGHPSSTSVDSPQAYQIIFLKEDFELGHQMCFVAESTFDPDNYLTHDRVRGVATKTSTTVDNAFVVQDIQDDLGLTQQERPVSRFVKRLQQFPQGRQGLEWTIDLSLVAHELSGSKRSSSASMMKTLQEIEAAANAEQDDETPPLRLFRHFDKGSNVHDVYEVNRALMLLVASSHVNDNGDQPSLTASRLSIPQLEDVDGLGDLSTAYDHILEEWIQPLPSAVSGRIRLAKERIARQMAAEVTLASHVLRLEQQSSDAAETQEQGELPTYQLDLPIRNMAASQGQSLALPQSSVLPTPSPTATPSVTTHASQSSAYAPQTYYITNITKFSKPLPISLPRTTQRVLRHWEVGADLDTYDWRSYSRRITRQTEAEDLDSQLTEQERARIQRKAERHLKRERKEAAATRQQQMLSSQMPELVVSASQPVPGMDQSQPQFSLNSSQSQPVAASQAVQGRYGTRPAKKKKRKQGF